MENCHGSIFDHFHLLMILQWTWPSRSFGEIRFCTAHPETGVIVSQRIRIAQTVHKAYNNSKRQVQNDVTVQTRCDGMSLLVIVSLKMSPLLLLYSFCCVCIRTCSMCHVGLLFWLAYIKNVCVMISVWPAWWLAGELTVCGFAATFLHTINMKKTP